MENFDLRKYLAEGRLLKEGEYTYTNDTNTEFGPDVLDLDYDKIRAYISTKKGDDFADNFIDGYNDNFYENVVRFFDKIENPTDEEVLNFIDIEIEKYLAEGKLLKEDQSPKFKIGDFVQPKSRDKYIGQIEDVYINKPENLEMKDGEYVYSVEKLNYRGKNAMSFDFKESDLESISDPTDYIKSLTPYKRKN